MWSELSFLHFVKFGMVQSLFMQIHYDLLLHYLLAFQQLDIFKVITVVWIEFCKLPDAGCLLSEVTGRIDFRRLAAAVLLNLV